MRTLTWFAVLFVVASCSDMPYIWPLPKEYTHGETTVTIDFRFFTPQQSNELIEAFQRYMDIIFYRKAAIVESGVRNVNVEVDEGKAELQMETDESYEIIIPDDGSDITIHAKNPFGAMHGLETISQLIV